MKCAQTQNDAIESSWWVQRGGFSFLQERSLSKAKEFVLSK